MEYVLSFIWIFMELAFFLLLSKAFLQSIKTTKQLVSTYLISGIVIFLIVNICTNSLLEQILTCACYIGVSFYLFSGSWVWHILVSVVCFIFAGIFDTAILYGICILLDISFNDFVWRKLSYSVTVTAGKLMVILFAWLIMRFRNRQERHKVQPKWLALTLTFPAVSLIMLFVIFDSYQDRNDLSAGAFLFSIGLAVSNIAILYLIQKMENQTKREYETLLLKQQMAIQTSSIIALEKSYRSQRQATHDFNSHLQTIGDLFHRNDTKSLQEYLDKLLSTQTSHILYVNSRHPIVDAVINQKYQIAKEHEIDIQIHINDLSGINMETHSIVVLLSNILDNALEACLRVDTDRTIQCSIISEDSLFISVRNTSRPVIINNNSIETSKEPKDEHGFGLVNIRYIMEQLNAEYTLNYEDGWFQFVAEIPM